MLNTIQTKVGFYTILLLVLVGCAQSPNLAPPLMPATNPSPRPTYSLKTDLVVNGNVVPKYVAELAYSIAGRVQSTDFKIGDEVHAGDRLVQLDTAVLEADVAHAAGALQAAQAELEYDELQRNAKQLQAITAAKISMAEADLAKARATLAQATLIAPLDGTIVDLQVVPGEMVSPGKVMLTLANLQTLQVETFDLSEDDIAKVYVGQPVEIRVKALNLKTEGIVVSIAPQPTLSGNKNIYKVTAEFKSQQSNLRWGMSVELNFAVDE